MGVVHSLADKVLKPLLVSPLPQHPHRVVPLLHQVAGVLPSPKIEGAGVLPLGQVPGPFTHLGVVQEDPREHQAVDVAVHRGPRELIHQVGELLHLHGVAVGDEHHAVAVVVVDQPGLAVLAPSLAPGGRARLGRCQHPGGSGADLEKLSSCGHGTDLVDQGWAIKGRWGTSPDGLFRVTSSKRSWGTTSDTTVDDMGSELGKNNEDKLKPCWGR